MIKNKFNIIIGDINTGRSGFLFNMCKILYDNGYITCFVLGEETDDHKLKYYLGNSYYQFINKNEVRLYEMINERKDIDVILIDDIDLISDECLGEIYKIDKIVISTCLSNNFNRIMSVEYYSCHTQMKSKIINLTKKTIMINDDIINREKYLKIFKRDLKLNLILDEK